MNPDAGARVSSDVALLTRPTPVRTPPRRIASALLTAVCAVLVLAALTVPAEVAQLQPAAFLRIPIEGLAGAAVLLVLRGRARTIGATIMGALVGVLLLVRVADLGFKATLGRPFEPVFDVSLLGNGMDFVTETAGHGAAIAALVGAIVLLLAVPTVLALAVRRLARLAGDRRRLSARILAALTAAWVVAALVGAQLVPPVPLASRSAASLAWSTAKQLPVDLQDQQQFAQQAATDPYGATPNLLGALKGKDVVVTYVESYGRSALEDPNYAAGVGATLARGQQDLAAAGYQARSGFLTSPVAGGGSWLAHATFLSGLWIDNQQRYRTLTSSTRLTLSKAFQRDGWSTVGISPGTSGPWPEGAYYGVDHDYDVHQLGYAGPTFGWSPMPDQYALEQFQQKAYGVPGRGPLLGQVTLTSSHVPWTPVPSMRPWDSLGDGSTYASDVVAQPSEKQVWSDPAQVRADYGRTIEYSLSSLYSWVQTYGNDNLVLIVLGDHQPAPIITGTSTNHDVPVSIISKDPSVLAKAAGWDWQAGLHPSPSAPVWPMDAFRDRFLQAFG